MRHGRKSKSKRFNGYKRHIAADLDTDLILAGAITPANRPEEEAAPGLQRTSSSRAARSPSCTSTAATLTSPLVDDVLGAGGEVVCKPWVARNGKSFAKARLQAQPSRPHDHLPRRRDGTHRVRRGRRVRSGGVRPLPATSELHGRRRRHWTHGRDRGERAPAAAGCESSRYDPTAAPAARARRRRAPARAYRPPAGPPRPLQRRSQEHLRPTPRRATQNLETIQRKAA